MLDVGANDASWFSRAFQMSRIQGAALVLLGLAFSWSATYLLGGAGRTPPHWFYLPILVSAVRFGAATTVVVAAAAGVLAGPLLPLDVDHGTQQPFSDWFGRTAFFVGNGLVMTFLVGQLKRALNREIHLAEAELELARHKEAFIQTVSHEFRTPLTVIIGTSQVLADPGVVAEGLEPLVAGLGRSARRLENLINVVLAAGGTLVDPGSHDERVVLRELCQRIAAESEGGKTRVRFQAATGAEVVVCDPQLLAIALQAVIDNALRFSFPSDPVSVSARRAGDNVEICVRDMGPGMSGEDVDQAFRPFTQKDESIGREKQGLGLGLYAARKTVDFLGGTLELRPARERGTEAVITIPEAQVKT